MRSTVVSRVIAAPPETVYRAFLDRDAVVTWLPPGTMTGVIHTFEPREGGAFRISLLYPEDDTAARGKSSARADTFHGRIVTLIPNEKIVWATEFESADPSLAGEMIIRWTLEPAGGGTRVTARFENVPPGLRLDDNEEGSRLTLDQLARFLER
jgi:uncharacterized protein YndB with AHSA1/START domain